MPKKAVIVVTLVDESREKINEELEKEIFDELSKAPAKIPWMKQASNPSNNSALRKSAFKSISIKSARPLACQ